jgi:hypothetical protein
MQTHFQVLAATLSASLILLVAAATVNHRSVSPEWNIKRPVADGIPMPPPIPPVKKPGGGVQFADGIPMPPPIPPVKKPGGSLA